MTPLYTLPSHLMPDAHILERMWVSSRVQTCACRFLTDLLIRECLNTEEIAPIQTLPYKDTLSNLWHFDFVNKHQQKHSFLIYADNSVNVFIRNPNTQTNTPNVEVLLWTFDVFPNFSQPNVMAQIAKGWSPCFAKLPSVSLSRKQQEQVTPSFLTFGFSKIDPKAFEFTKTLWALTKTHQDTLGLRDVDIKMMKFSFQTFAPDGSTTPPEFSLSHLKEPSTSALRTTNSMNHILSAFLQKNKAHLILTSFNMTTLDGRGHDLFLFANPDFQDNLSGHKRAMAKELERTLLQHTGTQPC